MALVGALTVGTNDLNPHVSEARSYSAQEEDEVIIEANPVAAWGLKGHLQWFDIRVIICFFTLSLSYSDSVFFIQIP